MNKCIYDENNALWYEMQGNYDILRNTAKVYFSRNPSANWRAVFS